MPGKKRYRGKFHAVRQLQFGITEGFEIKLVESILFFSGKDKILLIIAVTAHLPADCAVMIQFLSATDRNAISLLSGSRYSKRADINTAEIHKQTITLAALYCRKNLLPHDHCGRLQKEPVISVMFDHRFSPGGIIKKKLFKTAFRGGSIIAFQKLSLISGFSGGRIGGMFAKGKTLVRCQKNSGTAFHFTDHTMPVIAAYPDTVDQPLIIGVNGKDIFSFPQKTGHIDLIAEIMEMIPRRRSHTGKLSIDIQFIVIICCNKKLYSLPESICVNSKFLPEQKMLILSGKIPLCSVDLFQLPVKEHIDRSIPEIRRSDPLCLSKYFFHCSFFLHFREFSGKS